MAVNIPATGGKPLAMDIPRHRGNAIRKTKKPDMASDFQCSFKPANPVRGIF